MYVKRHFMNAACQWHKGGEVVLYCDRAAALAVVKVGIKGALAPGEWGGSRFTSVN